MDATARLGGTLWTCEVLPNTGYPSVRELLSAIEHFKEKDGVVGKSALVGFVDSGNGP